MKRTLIAVPVALVAMVMADALAYVVTNWLERQSSFGHTHAHFLNFLRMLTPGFVSLAVVFVAIATPSRWRVAIAAALLLARFVAFDYFLMAPGRARMAVSLGFAPSEFSKAAAKYGDSEVIQIFRDASRASAFGLAAGALAAALLARRRRLS